MNWVGIDGYYLGRSWTFASLFGPTIKAVRALTLDPITDFRDSVAPSAGKPAKIADLFAGVRAYGLLGFVWFDANAHGTGASAAQRQLPRSAVVPRLIREPGHERQAAA